MCYAILYCWYTQQANFSILLWYFHTSHRFWKYVPEDILFQRVYSRFFQFFSNISISTLSTPPAPLLAFTALYALRTSFCVIWNDFPSFAISSHYWLYVKRSYDDRIPSLRWHYIRFNATTNSSAPVMHILTFMFANVLACIFHLTLHDRTLLFPLWAYYRIPVTSTPTATHPVNRFPIGSSRHPHKTTVLTALVSLNDASSVLHFRSALRHTSDDFFSPFLIRSAPRILPGALISVLQPPPVWRLRRALLHLTKNIAFTL